MDTGVSVKIDMDARHDPAVAYQQTADNRQKRRLFQMSEDNDGRLFSQTNDPQDANRPSSRKINPGTCGENVPQINPAAVPHQHIDGETLIGKALAKRRRLFPCRRCQDARQICRCAAQMARLCPAAWPQLLNRYPPDDALLRRHPPDSNLSRYSQG